MSTSAIPFNRERKAIKSMFKPMTSRESPRVFLPSINWVLGTWHQQNAPLSGQSSSPAVKEIAADDIQSFSPAALWLGKAWSLEAGLREVNQSLPSIASRWGMEKRGLIHWMVEGGGICHTSFRYSGNALLAQLWICFIVSFRSENTVNHSWDVMLDRYVSMHNSSKQRIHLQKRQNLPLLWW